MACPICAWSPDERDYPFLYETAHWRVVLAPNQSLLGRCVVQCKRHVPDVAEQTPAELLDWLEVVKRVEHALRTAFDATMFNWSCYMNHSYRQRPYDPHMHWWAVPRYDHAVTFQKRTFDDPHFGNPYDHNRFMTIPDELRAEVVTQLRQALSA